MIQNKWIELSISSIAVAGVFSILIVILRTPIWAGLFDESVFKTALIIHVDLSVLFWMVTFMMMIMSGGITEKWEYIIGLLQNFLFLSLVLICSSIFFGEKKPYLNNYVPILHNIFFIVAIGIFFSCFTIISFISSISDKSNLKSIGILGVATSISFAISEYKLTLLDYQIDTHHFYELLFWAPGHILQFLFVDGLIVTWYYFFSGANKYIPLSLILWLNTLLATPVLIPQLYLAIDSEYYISFFTNHMRIFGGISFLLAMTSMIIAYYEYYYLNYSQIYSTYFNISTLPSHFKSKFNSKSIDTTNNSSWQVREDISITKLKSYSFIFSLLLFLVGGIIGLLINSINLVVPAHYHGSIVGITIAFMGYIYLKTNQLYCKINFRLAIWQIQIYSFGQIIHILALAYSGGYGALRKSPGAILPASAKISMGIMGLGGLIAIAGGLLFVYICARSIVTYKLKINDTNNKRRSD
ncbi:MAG: hypothetical protein SFT93_05200 [Rickettsiaceae bacterium]|nr:hypothetical protein [Rickettsiaceae bacterium]